MTLERSISISDSRRIHHLRLFRSQRNRENSFEIPDSGEQQRTSSQFPQKMASLKVMSSSNSKNSDLSRRNSSSASSSPSIRSNNLRRDPLAADHHHHQSNLSFGNDWTIHDDVDRSSNGDRNSVNDGGGRKKSVEDIWKEIVSGEKRPMIMKEEPHEQQEEMTMTLEDFLAKAEAIDNEIRDSDEIDVKMKIQQYDDDYPMIPQQEHNQFQMIERSGSGSMRGKRGRVMLMEEAMDKAAAQRQKRMIKNRESAARSRERKQAYQVELETLVRKLEEENEQLLKEIEEKTKERYKKLMEQLVPVVEKQRKPSPSSSRILSRSHSLEW